MWEGYGTLLGVGFFDNFRGPGYPFLGRVRGRNFLREVLYHLFRRGGLMVLCRFLAYLRFPFVLVNVPRPYFFFAKRLPFFERKACVL